ncbi:hypothetical protein N8I77_010555 [Diaporthe amygdali]|uniref:Arb2 domain-containing protein n=1 Tax=Phomopsis amygdali TaxID=1214568 RepID=A0AAD9S8K8_PHOAM|nr:hypothetical protein N8I77_010555 [Diaporthe amygdali]
MSMFRAKKLDLGCFVNVKVIRDHTKRKVYEKFEAERQALRYIIRNTTLPPRVRAEAQLQLTQMHCYTNPTQIRNRCILGGKGRGIFSDFKMSRLTRPSYFVEPKSDEIRLIDEPSFYFNYFISKNARHNDRQRFAFNTAVQAQLIHPRLEALGLAKLALPLGATDAAAPDDDDNKKKQPPHVPIFVSPGLKDKKRVVVIFGESEQELGVIAHRVIGGQGGVDKGSMVGIARALLQNNDHSDHNTQDQNQDQDDGSSAPGLILANTGELWWWPEGGRGLTPRGSQGAPMRSAVHWGRFRDARVNAIPGNESAGAHVACVFGQVLGSAELVAQDAVVQVVGVGDGAAAVERFLDRDWARWGGGGRVGCLAMFGSAVEDASVRDVGFRKFLREKARLYITCQEPVGTPISGPDGNDKTVLPTDYGTHVFSSGEKYYTELTLIKAKDALLAWLAEVDRVGAGYANPEVEVTYADELVDEAPTWDDGGGGVWEDRPAEVGAQMRTRQEDEEEGALEIISREEWEDRKRKEGKLDAAVPDNVFVVDKRKEDG